MKIDLPFNKILRHKEGKMTGKLEVFDKRELTKIACAEKRNIRILCH